MKADRCAPFLQRVSGNRLPPGVVEFRGARIRREIERPIRRATRLQVGPDALVINLVNLRITVAPLSFDARRAFGRSQIHDGIGQNRSRGMVRAGVESKRMDGKPGEQEGYE